ncbi:MAG: AAA domain-containing protein [Myxococcota bacterium]
MNPRTPLSQLDVEAVRFSLERNLAAVLEAEPGFALHRRACVPREPAAIRRRLLAQALRLTESMAAAAHRQASEAARVLGVTGAMELYQSSGRENAALHFVQTPILLEIQGRMLSLVDDEAAVALFGHELGHYLAHGPWNDLGATALAGSVLASEGLLSARGTQAAGQLVVAREITADRFGILACQDLDAALRLEMAATTGLSGESLSWDTEAYLEQCRELMEETLSAGDAAESTTHPEHSLRAWAQWLYWETAEFHALTGRGPGTRSLAEVDAKIEAALTGGGVSLEYDVRDEPPAFLAECALAGAVLIAHADGVVAPEELDAIEDAFSDRVPGWSELLDPDVARQRLYETAELVRAGGSDLARSLFLLLSHVMGADDVIDPREVQMLLAIGDVLGHGADFRRWVGPAVRAAGGEVEVESLEAVAVPLPMRRDEVRDALEALGESVARRGQMEIAPRRLLRLAAVPVEDAEGRARIERVLLHHHVECVPPLGHAGLDDRVLLRSTRPRVPEAAAEPEPVDGSRKTLAASLSRLRDELVTGDGRSPSVRLRTMRAARSFDLSRLDGVRPGAAERALALMMAGKVARLVTADDAGRHDAAHAVSRDLRQLDRSSRDRREETGANDLYLGYPLVVGNVAPRGEPGPGYGVRGPLLLYPIGLDRDGRGTRGFSAQRRPDDEPLANQSLLRVLFNKAALAFPDELGRTLDELAADPAGGVDAVLAKLREVGLVLRREGTTLVPFVERNADLDEKEPFLVVEECAVLGLFPQSSSDLLQDYDALLPQLLDPSVELPTLLAAGMGLLPAGSVGDSAAEPVASETVLASDELRWPVLAADPSQRQVAAECRRNQVTVVDGPPGTGKSQLIVNLVADALGRGERVAVVAEKRAALDVVYQRLADCGLADSVALVHDVVDDRRALYRQLQARLTGFSPRADDATRRGVLQQEHEQVQARLQTRRAALAYRPEGTELTVGQLLAITATEPTELSLPALADLDRHALATVLELVERLHPYRELWEPRGFWRSVHGEPPRVSLAQVDDAGLMALRRTVDEALAPAAAADEALATDPIDRQILLEGAAALQRLVVGSGARAEPRDAQVFVALSLQPLAPIEEVRRQWEERAAALAQYPAPVRMPTDEALTQNLAILRSFAGRWTRPFSGVWWKARGELRRALAQAWPEQAAADFSAAFLDSLHARIQATQAWDAMAVLWQGLHLDPHYAPQDATQGQACLLAMLGLQRQVHAAQADAALLAPLGLALPGSLEQRAAFEARVTQRQAQVEALHHLQSALAPVHAYFPGVGAPSQDVLAIVRERLTLDGQRLREADGWLAQLDARFGHARTLLDALARLEPEASASAWRETVARAWAAAHVERVRGVVPALADLGTGAEAQRTGRDAETLRSLQTQLRDQEVARLQASLDQAELLNIPDAAYRARRNPQQKLKEGLLREVGKKRQLWPMRRFVREFSPQGLLHALPCWLLSPETMVVLFPRQPLFDLVIFDEASQCTVEAGFPVALRANRVVIAGDEQQMPPTSFFRMGSGGTEDEDRSEEERSVRDAFSGESLLALARARCPHVGLQWHYRCREEELIAFSNHAMYEGGLRTIPSIRGPGAKPALRWIDVEGGSYDRGLNRPEAERVVDLLDELLQRDPAPTLGVITFNIRQRETIFETIDARVESDEAFAKRWTAATGAEALHERPFIKNLESVQGDERDVIIFSLGHAPVERKRQGGSAERYVPARFGPLGQRGGERRLNVAISRAKSECYLVASFDPKLLHVGGSTHDGPRLFKAFLEFAHHLEKGRRVQAERILDEVRGQAIRAPQQRAAMALDGYVPLAAQLALALEERGLHCALDLGRSDFRVPLAVGHPEDPEGFRVAVMCDEGERALSVFEQHVHQPAVLALRGWSVVPVDPAQWARRRSDVLDAIEQRVRDVTPAGLADYSN